jgi:hypothetical protein
MSDNIRRVVKAICAVIACAGVLIVVLSLCLLVFGSKAEGVYKETLSVNGSRYTYLYTYTADGAEYEYTMTRRFPRGEGEHSTQKISYLVFAPSVAYTGGMTGLGMIVAAVGGLGFFAAAGDKNRPRPAAGKSPQWNSYLNKVKSGNKQE